MLKLPSLFTRAWWRARAKSKSVRISDSDGWLDMGEMKPREFKTGSLGWHVTGKRRVRVGDCMVWAQISVQVTVIGSKALPSDQTEPQVVLSST